MVGSRFQAHTSSMRGVASGIDSRADAIDGVGTTIGSASLSGALGPLGEAFAGTAQQHFAHAGQVASAVAQRHHGSASSLRTTAQNYDQADADSANRLRSISWTTNTATPRGPQGGGQAAGSGQQSDTTQVGGYGLRSYVSRPGQSASGGAGGDDGEDPRKPWRRLGGHATDDYTSYGYGDEASNMMQLGDQWYDTRRKKETGVEISPQEQAQFTGRLNQFNTQLTQGGHNLQVRPPGRNQFEPFVARQGVGLRPYGRDTYQNLTNHVTSQPDGGAGAAAQLHQWASGQVPLRQLPQHLQDFAVITHFAEPARGYSHQVVGFDQEMGRIAQMGPQDAANRWGQIHDSPDEGGWFWPAQTQINADGPAHRYQPGPDPDSDEEMED